MSAGLAFNEEEPFRPISSFNQLVAQLIEQHNLDVTQAARRARSQMKEEVGAHFLALEQHVDALRSTGRFTDFHVHEHSSDLGKTHDGTLGIEDFSKMNGRLHQTAGSFHRVGFQPEAIPEQPMDDDSQGSTPSQRIMVKPKATDEPAWSAAQKEFSETSQSEHDEVSPEESKASRESHMESEIKRLAQQQTLSVLDQPPPKKRTAFDRAFGRIATSTSFADPEEQRLPIRMSMMSRNSDFVTQAIDNMRLLTMRQRLLPRRSASALVTNPAFDRVSGLLLVLNALFIGAQVECEFLPETPPAIQVIDWVFTVLFFTELALRIWGFGACIFFCDKTDLLWNWFDFIIVTASTMDAVVSVVYSGQSSPLANLSILRIVRVVRITRVLRIIRVMKFFRDLRILLAAIASTLKAASFAFLLILIAMYTFGMGITQLVAEFISDARARGEPLPDDDPLVFFFGSIWKALFTMFISISGGVDWKDVASPLIDANPLSAVFYVVYVAFMLLCAIESAGKDKENIIQLQMSEKHRYVNTLAGLFRSWDDSQDGKCTIEEFKRHMHDPETEALLMSLEIEVRDALMLFETLDANRSGEIDLQEFVAGCIQLRGSAKAIHMEKQRVMAKNVSSRLESKIDSMVNDVYLCNADMKRQLSDLAVAVAALKKNNPDPLFQTWMRSRTNWVAEDVDEC
eukprot:TRINITY_DN81212_c0_g1_i1.p1 TRINITY_DN81212_c0_g1~~TRINITY_DN81212_c0_g1_i1.p1  ORF type:complete len:700 (+),score=121.82 TRINITY_DN81212_c0_g1_i1:46-2100(+)